MIVGYNAQVMLKSGGTVSILLSLTTVNEVADNHRKTGGFFAADIGTKEIISVHKSAIEFVKFVPILQKETEADDGGNTKKSDGAVSEEQGQATSADDCSSDPVQVRESD